MKKLTSKSETEVLHDLIDMVNEIDVDYDRSTIFIQKISLLFLCKGNVSFKEFLALYKEYSMGD